jgi:glycosyltransferase involved in cell wall biosynthesis
MNVLMFVTNPFTNDPRVYAEAKSLIGAGHSVTVIARDWTGEPAHQTWDGIEIVRLTSPMRPRPGLAALAAAYASLRQWQTKAYREAIDLNRRTPFDIVHCHDVDTISIGNRLKRKLGIGLVYDAHEIYGYMMMGSLHHWPWPTIGKIILWQEKRLLTDIDQLITVNESFQEYFARATGKPVALVMNCKPLQGTQYEPPPAGRAFTVLYIGSLGGARGINMLVDAVAPLAGVQCIIGGIGDPTYVQALRQKCQTVPNVRFIGKVPFDMVIPKTKEADVVFCMFDPGEMNNVVGSPNKLYEAMACGRPIICTKGIYSGTTTDREESGLTADYNVESLTLVLVRLRDDPELREKLGRNALRAAVTKYNWRKQEETLIEVYRSLKPS